MGITEFAILAALIVRVVYGCGYAQGKHDARLQQIRDEEAWWSKVESEVGEERVKIWREESELP